MHIALVKKHYSLRRGGAERYCVNLARGLTRLGHSVSVVGERIDAELAGEVRFLPVRVWHTSSWAKNLTFARNAAAAIERSGCDVSIGLCPTPAVDVFRVTGRIHPYWMTIRYPNPVWRSVQRLNPRHRAILHLEREIFERSSSVRRVIVQSQLERRLVQDYYGVGADRLRVIYNGVDLGTFHPGARGAGREVRSELEIPAEAPLVVFASAVDYAGKGLASVIEAIARLRDRRAHLLVVGGARHEAFARLAARLGILPRVRFVGRQVRLERYLGAADLFALPSIYEPFPNVNLEALACGTPVLTTATSGGADVIHEGGNGYVVSHGHAVDEMVERIDRHLATSPQARRRMSEHCWEVARELSVDRNAASVAELCAEVLAAKGGSSRWTRREPCAA
jgi:UDP-glucose:(heptosyl)LPS alpha-1,3-glucosyltransferase